MLNAAQLLALKNDIIANPTYDAMRLIGQDTELCDIYNAVTATIVWRSEVSQDTIMQNGFDWTRVDNLSVGKARIWEWMFDNANKIINPSKANVRAGIDAVWVGTTADLAVRAVVYTHCKRAATKLEKLFATGTGTDAIPALLGVEGFIGVNEMSTTRN